MMALLVVGLALSAGLVLSVIVVAIYRLADWIGQERGWWQ